MDVTERTVPTRDKEWMDVYKSLAEQIRTVYGEKLKSVILYGSVARGTATEESDIDIMVLVDASPEELKGYFESLRDVSCNFALEYFKVFSIIDISKAEYDDWKEILPFYANIEKEGVVLYAA